MFCIKQIGINQNAIKFKIKNLVIIQQQNIFFFKNYKHINYKYKNLTNYQLSIQYLTNITNSKTMYTQQSQHLIQQLNRKISLLDEYASTLQRQNLAKNNETATLYLQLDEIRNENDILRSHLSRINQENVERMKREQTLKEIEKINNSVNSSVELSLHKHQKGAQKKGQQQHQQEQMTISVSCQTEFTQTIPAIDPSTIHQSCTLQIQKLLSTITLKDTRIQQLTNQSQQMYDTIIHLQQENQSLRKQLQQGQRQLLETEKYYKQTQTKFKTQSKQMKSYQLQIQELRTVLEEQREIMENQRREIQLQKDTNYMAENEVDRLIRENNRLIERIRMLEKQKNTFYAQLRGKNVSPLKTSQISARQANMPTEKDHSSITITIVIHLNKNHSHKDSHLNSVLVSKRKNLKPTDGELLRINSIVSKRKINSLKLT